MRVLLVAPVAPPYGGMALQAQQLRTLLQRDGVEVDGLASNFSFPSAIGVVERLPGVRTAVRAALIWPLLWRRVRHVDVVHVFAASWLYFFLVVYPAVLVARACRKRVVLNYRGGDAKAFFGRYGWLARPVFRLASAVAVPSEFLAALIRGRFGVDVAIVPNVLDRSRFTGQERTTIRPRLLVTRHLEPIYDVASVLKAFRAVQQNHPSAALLIAGSGSEEASLRMLAASWQLSHVSFLGELSQPDLAALYRSCDIYVNASRIDNFPGSLLEASAAGLVVVTTAAGGIPFIYEHGRTALFAEPGDWEGLASAIERVLAHPPDALAMARAAADVVRAFDWTEVRTRLFAAYGFTAASLPGGAAGVGGVRCAAG